MVHAGVDVLPPAEVTEVLSMTEVLRQASTHFARTRKMHHEKSRIGVREAERYRELVKRTSYAGKDCPHGFIYNPTFPVGECIYQFFAQSKTRQSREARRAASMTCHRPRLKLLIPDTLVFNLDDEPCWYYTDKDGYVARTAKFEPGEAVEQLGDVRFDGDLAAVRKQSCLLPVTGLGEGSDPAALYSDGNALALVNTRDLRVITGVTTGKDGGGGAAHAPDGGEPFVVQKFIKSKGPHAFIVRQVVEHNLPPTAWMISNKQPYGGEEEQIFNDGPTDSLLLAGPNSIGRYVTTPKKDRACGITRLGPGACGETSEATARILHHLEAVLEKRMSILVCDFTRDDRGRLWFFQVKAFRFLGCTPLRPFRLTGKAREDARLRLAEENFQVSSLPGEPEDTTIRERKVSGQRRRRRKTSSDNGNSKAVYYDTRRSENTPVGAGEGLSRGDVGTEDTGVSRSRRLMACGMCGALLSFEELSYRMTVKMVRETLVHIWSRLPTRLVPQCISANNNVGSAAVAVRSNRAAAGSNHVAAVGSTNTLLCSSNSDNSGSSNNNRNVRACEACFTLHQTEAMLMRAKRRVALAVGIKQDNSFSGFRSDKKAVGRARGGISDGAREVQLSRRMQEKREVQRWGRVLSKRQACGAVDPLDVPDGLTLCRILVAITDLLDVPTAFLQSSSRNNGHLLELRYDLLGRRVTIPVEIPAQLSREVQRQEDWKGITDTKESEDAQQNERAEEDEEAGCTRTTFRGSVNLPVSSFRVFSFLSPDTPLQGDLPKASGLDNFLSSKREGIVVSLHLIPNKNRKMNNTKETRDCMAREEHTDDIHGNCNSTANSGSSNDGRDGTTPITGSAGRKTQGDANALDNDSKPRERRGAVSSGRMGETRLGLEQFRNGHIEQVELQAPLLLKNSSKEGRSSLVLLKAFVGLERVRTDVNVSMLPHPLLLHERSVFVVDGGRAAEEYHTCDPLPEAWVTGGNRRHYGATAVSGCPSFSSLEKVGTTRCPNRRRRSRKKHGGEPELGVGLCLCIHGIRRPRELSSFSSCAPPASSTPNGHEIRVSAAEHSKWRIKCTLFGHDMLAEDLANNTPCTQTTASDEQNSERPTNGDARKLSPGGSDINAKRKARNEQLFLGGSEAHLYLQCGLSTLKQALRRREGNGDENDNSDGDCYRDGVTLDVELLYCGRKDDAGRDDETGECVDWIVVCGREVGLLDPLVTCCPVVNAFGVRSITKIPLSTLVEDRYTEGTYPLVRANSDATTTKINTNTTSAPHHNPAKPFCLGQDDDGDSNHDR